MDAKIIASHGINIPGVNYTSYDAYGDSITWGYDASVPANAYVSLIGYALGVLPTNHGVSGSQAADQQDAIYGTVVPSTGNSLYTYMIGTNDLWIYGGDATLQALFQAFEAAGAAWLAIPDTKKIKGQSGGVTYTGTWANSGYYGGAVGKVATASGNTATLFVFGTTAYVAYTVEDGSTGAFTITIDGVLVGSYTTAASGGALVQTNLQNSPLGAHIYTTQTGHGSALLRFSGLPYGTHTVVMTTTSSGSVYLDWAAGNAGLYGDGGPNLFLGGVPRQGISGSDAGVFAYSALVRSNVAALQSDGLNVAYVDDTAYIDPAADIITTDYVHPNDSGMQHIANAFLAVIGPVSPGSQLMSISSIGGSGATGVIESDSGLVVKSASVGVAATFEPIDIFNQSMAGGDTSGSIVKFSGMSNLNNKRVYAAIQSGVTDNTDTVEGGSLRFKIISSGVLTEMASLNQIGQLQVVNFVISTAANTQNGVNFAVSGSRRWAITGLTGAESGSNSGSNLEIAAFNDAGGFMFDVLTVNRATGELKVPNNITFDNGTANTQNGVKFKLNGSSRWTITGLTGAESGSNSGSNLEIAAFDDSGAFLFDVLTVNRATGEIRVLNNITFDNGTANTQNGVNFAVSGSRRWTITGLTGAESGSNSGSNLEIAAFSDSGGFLFDVLTVNRATGEIRITNSLATRGITATQLSTATGTCDTVGTAVTSTGSGDDFVTLQVTGIININGVNYTIASISDATHLVLTSTAGTQTGVTWGVAFSLNTNGVKRLSIDTSGNSTFIGAITGGIGVTLKQDATPVSNWAATQLIISGATDPNKQLTIGFDTTVNVGFIQAGWQTHSYQELRLNPNGGTVTIPNLSVTGTATLPSLAGITSTGPITISTAANSQNGLNFSVSNSRRWTITGLTGAESGGNSGSNLEIAAFNDAGGYLFDVLTVNRATGALSVVNGFVHSGSSVSLSNPATWRTALSAMGTGNGPSGGATMGVVTSDAGLTLASTTVSNPPTQAEVQAIVTRLNAVINWLNSSTTQSKTAAVVSGDGLVTGVTKTP